MTRFEKIKSMDIDEFADYCMGEICGKFDDCPIGQNSCHDCVKAWLEEEVDD